MAKFPNYDLQTLFDLRERKKKETEKVYAATQKKLADAEKQLKTMNETLIQMQTLRENKKIEYSNAIKDGSMKIDKIEINNNHLKMLEDKEEAYKKEIEKQKEVVEKAKEEVKKALDIMLKATQEFKTLEKHKEKWLKTTKKTIAKKESDNADEISQAQYLAKLRE